MRIISKFHDYYDVVQATGQDQTLIYNREPKQILWTKRSYILDRPDSGDWPFPILNENSILGFQDTLKCLDNFTIGFCGKVYPLIKLSLDAINYHLCFTANDIHEFVENNSNKQRLKEYNSNKDKSWRKSPYKSYYGETIYYMNIRKNVEAFFEEYKRIQNDFIYLFRDNQSPQFVAGYHAEGHEITFNASLKEKKFYRVIDPFTAFQEISMYWGGIAHPEKPLPHIPDKIMVEAKGFDKKWSFRKRPNNNG